MPVKLRLQRHGKKGKPFYWLVAADSRAKRDGRYLEKLGTYNPNTNPATVNIDIDRAVNWLEKGAQPTNTARTLLSYRGAMMKHHLNGGVRKGALTQEVADQKLADWLKEKEAKILAKKEGLTKAEAEAQAKRIAAEKEASEKRLAEAAAEEVETPSETVATEEGAAEETTPAEATSEEVATEEAPVEEETPEETKTEAAPVEEAPVEEAPVEEAPAKETKPEETPTEEGQSDSEEGKAE
ncbi:30S ribosomal protein S16 [Flavobacteriaceae bacterium]|jgi:small subunit ribosomal protein S16|nr:30S ribosomal protein S16 [Flavobacteriaceae bacterium]MDA8877533.1 30S ribosomal protein S16 [Flavobacteriaceae bacterium]MDA9037991.1 30S ribosomal protein S16 [Flavobacteriaceae bacterium]